MSGIEKNNMGPQVSEQLRLLDGACGALLRDVQTAVGCTSMLSATQEDVQEFARGLTR